MIQVPPCGGRSASLAATDAPWIELAIGIIWFEARPKLQPDDILQPLVCLQREFLGFKGCFLIIGCRAVRLMDEGFGSGIRVKVTDASAESGEAPGKAYSLRPL